VSRARAGEVSIARPSRGVLFAAVCGVALLIVMFVFDWFGSSGTSVEIDPDFLGLENVGLNAWQSFSILDWVLLVTAVAAIGAALIEATSRSVNSPVVAEAVVCSLGALAALLLVIRIIDPPGDLNREVGVYVGLAFALGIAYGGWKAMADEGTSFADQASRL
jgi:hypothetical protein